ncbi:MAG: GGDEF domain-containing protein [Candidatus Hinthialibacter antarcticus]|nr:GGDEF domain-containing protein [Candidatus Hinthialibacter antarcticus]
MNQQQFDSTLLRQLFETMPEGVCLLDPKGVVAFDNKTARALNDGKSLLNIQAEDLIQCVDLDSGDSPIDDTIRDGQLRTTSGLLTPPNGAPKTVAFQIFRLTVSNQENWIAIFIRDNSEDLQNQERMRILETQCLVDSLTELPNRTMLSSNLATRFHEFQRFGWAFGVMMIDIDHFKVFNDQYGHDIGDVVLQSTGRMLSKNLRPFDIVGRWGGEEFVAVIANVDKFGMLSAAERTRFQVRKTAS